MKLDLQSHMKFHPAIRVTHTIFYVEHLEYIALAEAKRPGQVPSIKEQQHVSDKILRHRKKQRGFPSFTLMKDELQDDAVRQPTEEVLCNDGIVTEAWQKYIQEIEYCQSIIDEYVNGRSLGVV